MNSPLTFKGRRGHGACVVEGGLRQADAAYQFIRHLERRPVQPGCDPLMRKVAD
jgi:hypothetical protein